MATRAETTDVSIRDSSTPRPPAATIPHITGPDASAAPAIRPRPGTRGTAPRPGGAPPSRSKPNPLPMRLAIGAGGLAAFSALLVAIAGPVAAWADTGASASQAPAADNPDLGPVRTVVRTVVLQPGQSAPDGSLVVPVATPAPKQQQRVKIVTCQSGTCK